MRQGRCNSLDTSKFCSALLPPSRLPVVSTLGSFPAYRNQSAGPSGELSSTHYQWPLTAMVTTVRSAKAVITTFWRMFSCQGEGGSWWLICSVDGAGDGSGNAGPAPIYPSS